MTEYVVSHYKDGNHKTGRVFKSKWRAFAWALHPRYWLHTTTIKVEGY